MLGLAAATWLFVTYFAPATVHLLTGSLGLEVGSSTDPAEREADDVTRAAVRGESQESVRRQPEQEEDELALHRQSEEEVALRRQPEDEEGDPFRSRQPVRNDENAL